MSARKERLTVTVDPALIEAGNDAVAEGRAESLSAWVNAALAARVATERRLAALADAVPDDSPVKGKVRAKSGTLVFFDAMNDRMLLRSKALAGTIETAKGSKLCFAMFVDDVPLPQGASATREGKVLAKLCEIIYQNGP